MGAASGELILIRMRLSGGRQVAAESKAAATGIAEVGTAANASNAKTTAATRGIQSSMSKTASSAARLKTVGSSLTKFVTVPIAGIGIAAGVLAIDFDKSMRNVNSIAQLPEGQFKKLRESVLDLAGKTAQTPKTLAEGLYDLVSSGFKANEAIGVLHASAKAATAGLTTTEVSTKAVAAVLNAYRLPASKAAAVSDDLFQTVNLGVVTFDELASSIGYVLPTASTLGVNLKEVGASISTLTKEGQSGQTAVTNINAALTSLIKPTTDMKGALADLGFDDATKLIEKKGFLGSLQAVIGTTDGTKEAIGKLFPNVRAMRAVFGLTGQNIDAARADLKGFANDAGATDKVLEEQRKSVSFVWNQFKADASAALIRIGDQILPTLLPVLKGLLGGIVEVTKGFAKLPGPVRTILLVFGLLAALTGPILVFFATLMTALGALGIELTFIDLLLSPWLLIPVAIAAIAIALVLLYHRSAAVRAVLDGIAAGFKWIIKAGVAVFQWVKTHWQLLAVALSGPFFPFVLVTVSQFDRIKGIVSSVFNWMKGAAKTVAHAIGSAFGTVGGAVAGAWSGITGVVIGILNTIIRAINTVIDAVDDLPGVGNLHEIGQIGTGAPGTTATPGGSKSRGGGSPTRRIGASALGGPIASTGYRWVGEFGPELVKLPAQARVKTTEMSRSAVRTPERMKRAVADGKVFKETYLVLTRDGKKIIAESSKKEELDAKARQ